MTANLFKTILIIAYESIAASLSLLESKELFITTLCLHYDFQYKNVRSEKVQQVDDQGQILINVCVIMQ